MPGQTRTEPMSHAAIMGQGMNGSLCLCRAFAHDYPSPQALAESSDLKCSLKLHRPLASLLSLVILSQPCVSLSVSVSIFPEHRFPMISGLSKWIDTSDATYNNATTMEKS